MNNDRIGFYLVLAFMLVLWVFSMGQGRAQGIMITGVDPATIIDGNSEEGLADFSGNVQYVYNYQTFGLGRGGADTVQESGPTLPNVINLDLTRLGAPAFMPGDNVDIHVYDSDSGNQLSVLDFLIPSGGNTGTVDWSVEHSREAQSGGFPSAIVVGAAQQSPPPSDDIRNKLSAALGYITPFSATVFVIIITASLLAVGARFSRRAA